MDPIVCFSQSLLCLHVLVEADKILMVVYVHVSEIVNKVFPLSVVWFRDLVITYCHQLLTDFYFTSSCLAICFNLCPIIIFHSYVFNLFFPSGFHVILLLLLFPLKQNLFKHMFGYYHRCYLHCFTYINVQLHCCIYVY